MNPLFSDRSSASEIVLMVSDSNQNLQVLFHLWSFHLVLLLNILGQFLDMPPLLLVGINHEYSNPLRYLLEIVGAS
jgi:hypothetical protein